MLDLGREVADISLTEPFSVCVYLILRTLYFLYEFILINVHLTFGEHSRFLKMHSDFRDVLIIMLGSLIVVTYLPALWIQAPAAVGCNQLAGNQTRTRYIQRQACSSNNNNNSNNNTINNNERGIS